ncbi:MAG: pyruvate carboxylase [Tropheryma whipplei]|uniref:pyruvate carboxylase n=1 Tax=Tropheryma whipplei TaxID=2039 RepID=UPI000000C8EA|nr:pyruvate carboxylase [Tropheryma whipplei]MCO8182440.1 pyruvate carboxylase [Tropheryma whipplei]CAD67310.1 pyruvate carboxylase [Tropheryma whipplei TW08/27]
MFKKILIANRGEIAIRISRAAFERQIQTVAIYAHEDRNSLHRLKADEAYQIGQVGSPVAAYLDVHEIIRVALMSNSDAIHPGYGFLSESYLLADEAEKNGITFIGPPKDVLKSAGDKVLAKHMAQAAGLPTLRSSTASSNYDELLREAELFEYPIFVKAASGGGGRGMRIVENRTALKNSLESAIQEAAASFGDPRVFLETALDKPRHIEVQVLADKFGNIVHLFERDCSLQRRHQKVIEIAPAPNIPELLRTTLYRDAIAFAKSVKYENAGTVEFLVDSKMNHYFIEMNPRIQVEHTVTEEITDIDIVQSQIRIAAGASLDDIGLVQDKIERRGFALQCRITTEDPHANFRPDTGRITSYQSPGGAGIRLDASAVNPGVEITPYFDSMLVKMTCRGNSFADATNRARRGLAEFRVGGVATNISFLRTLLDSSNFLNADFDTTFIEKNGYLLQQSFLLDKHDRLVSYLGHVTVNKPYGDRPELVDPCSKIANFLPDSSEVKKSVEGSRDVLLRLGPQGFAKWLLCRKGLAVTDTTFRDAHQSLLATRVRTIDLSRAAECTSAALPELFSMEVWGGATYDVALRFLYEDPWERLSKIREKVGSICLQMLLRGRNTVGYTPYPDQVTRAFVDEASDLGIDIFRIFDALNDVDQMRIAIDAVQQTNSVAEVAICYTGDLLDKRETVYTIDYYLEIAKKIVDAGAHILAIKDMAGVLRPRAATLLVSALKREFALPVHLHTHDTPGGQLATLLAAADSGVDAVDVASGPMSGTTSQPSMSSLVAATDNTEHETGLSLSRVNELEPYWEAVRRLYVPFESGLLSPTGRVYIHEIPGGQLSNLKQQAIALGLSDRFEIIEEMYAYVNTLFGRIPKVTPSSKVVGDLALYLASVNPDLGDFEMNPKKYDIPDSVISFLAGELGTPPAGWPDFRDRVLAEREISIEQHPLSSDDSKNLATSGKIRQQTLSKLLFPEPYRAFEANRAEYGDLSILRSEEFFYGLDFGIEYKIAVSSSVGILVRLEAIGGVDSKGERSLVLSVNGELRPIQVRDESANVEVSRAEKADPNNPGHIASPFAGQVTIKVDVGDEVVSGQAVAILEAMKMTTVVNAPVSGQVIRISIPPGRQVDIGDLIMEIRV